MIFDGAHAPSVVEATKVIPFPNRQEQYYAFNGRNRSFFRMDTSCMPYEHALRFAISRRPERSDRGGLLNR
jgi:hypothetical protein